METTKAMAATPVSDVRMKAVGAKLYPGGFEVASGLTKCILRDGTTGIHDDFGNSFSETFRVGIGTGFRSANVQLSGWDLNYWSKDHHIDRVQVRIRDVGYDPKTGEVTFTVNGYYRDKNGDDDFQWEVWYTILALG